MSKFTVADFSGGLTDSPYSSPENCAAAFENLLINKDKSARGIPGVEIFSSTAYQVTGGERVSNIVKLDDDTFIAFSNKKAFTVTSSAVTEVTGPSGNPAFNAGDANSIVSIARFNNQLFCTNDALSYPIKIYKDDGGVVRLRNAGLPAVGGATTVTASVPASRNHIWAIVYSYEYKVGNVTFTDIGPITLVSTSTGANPDSGDTNTLGSIPVLSNGATYNYDTANIKKKIYRTTHGGDTFYYVTEIPNATTTYVDGENDADIILNETLYTTGGIVENDSPPPSKYIFEANDTCYWLNIEQSTAELPYKGLQSITNDPDSVPADFLFELKDDLTGGGTVGRSPIVFTEGSTARLEGIIDETGRGSILKEYISNTVGTISHQSIVRGSRGIYFAGPDGFYFTDGYSEPTKLAKKDPFSSKIDNIYKDWIDTAEQRSRIQGTYDNRNRRVYWTVQEDSTDNDKLVVYDETHDAFTAVSFTSGILPTSIVMDGDDLIIGDSNGYIFKMSDSYYNMPVVDTGTAATLWKEDPIIYSWKSVQLTMGDASVNKWITSINTQGNPDTNVAIEIRSYTNGEDQYKSLYPLKVSPSWTWGDPEFTWGDDSFVWNRKSNLNQTRNFSRGRLRARQRQIEFTNAYYTIQESTSNAASYVTINATLNTATLVTPSTYSFGLNNEGYDLYIDGVAYEITSGTADTLVLDDPNNTLVNGTYAWQMKGYGKGQRPHLLNFSVEYEPLNDAGTWWRGSSES